MADVTVAILQAASPTSTGSNPAGVDFGMSWGIAKRGGNQASFFAFEDSSQAAAAPELSLDSDAILHRSGVWAVTAQDFDADGFSLNFTAGGQGVSMVADDEADRE